MLNCCIDLEMVKKTGINLGTFVCLARCQGLAVDARRAEESTVEEFREAVRKSCVSEEGERERPVFLVASYSRKIFEQTGDGHFSPVAAYDEVSDKALILDTARFKYGPHWVPLQLLFDAMVPCDKDTGRSRGYVLLSFDGDDTSSDLPLQSVLFRSKKSQDPVRRQYQHFLKSRPSADPISFQEVETFWTKGGKDTRFIFDMIEPQLYPVDKREAQLVEDMLQLVRSLIGDIRRKIGSDGDYNEALNECCGDKCGPNAFRKIHVSVIEAMFVAFLASLSPVGRRELVYGRQEGKKNEESNGEFSDVERDQLIREAELVQYAVDMSCEDERKQA